MRRGRCAALRRSYRLGVHRAARAVIESMMPALAEVTAVSSRMIRRSRPETPGQGGGVLQRVETDGWDADWQTAQSLRSRSRPRSASCRRVVVPFGAADRAEENRIGRMSESHGLVGDGHAFHIQRRATHECALDRERKAAILCQPIDDSLGLGHHFRTDAVARKKQDFIGHEVYPRSRKERALPFPFRVSRRARKGPRGSITPTPKVG